MKCLDKEEVYLLLDIAKKPGGICTPDEIGGDSPALHGLIAKGLVAKATAANGVEQVWLTLRGLAAVQPKKETSS